MTPRSLGERLAIAGTVVALLDGAFAVVLFVVILKVCDVEQLFQSIATALLGESAFYDGLPAAALGLALHCAVAFFWAAVYLVTWERSAWLRRLTHMECGTVAVGLVFGAIVWLAMNRIVVPLSRHTTTVPVMSVVFFVELAGHMLLVGPPIAFIAETRARSVSLA